VNVIRLYYNRLRAYVLNKEDNIVQLTLPQIAFHEIISYSSLNRDIMDCQTFFDIDWLTLQVNLLLNLPVNLIRDIKYRQFLGYIFQIVINVSIAVIYKTADISELCNLNPFLLFVCKYEQKGITANSESISFRL